MLIRTIDTYHHDLERIVELSDTATFYHSRVWIESLAAIFPHLSFRCLVSQDGESISGFLPYFRIHRGPLHSVWSLPYGTYGGPVALDGDTADGLIDYYARTVPATGTLAVGLIDYNDLGTTASLAGWKKRVLSTHHIDISGGFDRFWEKTLDRQRRKRTRRAQRLGVEVRRATSGSDLGRYHDIYSSRMDQWGGGRAHPRELFAALLERGGESVRLYVAEHDGQIVGGHFNFYFKDTVTAWTGVTTRESNHLQVGTALYIRCLRDACDEGYRVYNLGGSLDKQSLIEFKESLGGTPYEYCQYTRRSFLGRVAAWVTGAGRR
jgi:hypothetical protein